MNIKLIEYKHMENSIIEAHYPLSFRQNEAQELGKHLKNRHSVVLVGMRRVGISNFLRFFLNHRNIVDTYIEKGKKHLFIPVDLNDLVEREIFPFWTLTSKRIVDAVEKSSLDKRIQKEIEALFLNSIQSQDLFLTIDNVRVSLLKLVENNILPTLFLLRFDRIKEAVTPEFFSNLQGLKDATHQRLSYVFTSFRGLDTLSPAVFTKASLSVFVHDMYMKPAQKEDAKVISETYKNRYKLKLTPSLQQVLFNTVDGYVQYLQLALIFLQEKKSPVKNEEELFNSLVKDERISLQSEELWESLDTSEKAVLMKVSRGQGILKEDKIKGKYLWDTGMITENPPDGGWKRVLFSPLFDYYIQQKEKDQAENGVVEFTKKEHLLFSFLEKNMGGICEREKIIESVWPEVEALGVSDWAIDRLVARVRSKLKQQKNSYEIQTVKTRGYKLISS